MPTQRIEKLHQDAQKFLNNADIKSAHYSLITILQLDPNYIDAYFLLGMVNLQIGKLKKSIALIEKALSFEMNYEYLAQLAKCFVLSGDLKKAKDCTDLVIESNITAASVADTFGVTLNHIGSHDTAFKFFQRALTLNKNNAQIYYNYGVCCKFMGDFKAAEDAFESAIALRENHHQAHFALSDIGNTNVQCNHIKRLNSVFVKTKNADAQLHIGHALAKEYESIDEFSKAFDILNISKKKKLLSFKYDFDEQKDLFRHIHSMSRKSADMAGCCSNEPIFILGMPRSGTTLVERIISSHSNVTSAGELQDFGMSVKELTGTKTNKVLDIETISSAYKLNFKILGEHYLNRTRTITGNTPRFTDKLPFNFFYVDLIQKTFPNAKIICLLRNPLDTCIGNYRQLFTLNNPYYGYSLDLNLTARFYVEFYKLTMHWQNMNYQNFKLLTYENLVKGGDLEIKKLIEFCDLPWEDPCLSFYDNEAPVSTASKVQVREPINTKSIGRWKNYQAQLEEIKTMFEKEGIATRF